MSRADGGPAFPGETEVLIDGGVRIGRAQTPGMSLRDYFAANAMQGRMESANFSSMHSKTQARQVAEFAYMVADAMLVVRAQAGG